MKKLIIYDESCPMCRVYTKGMIAADTSGCLTRLSNSELTNELLINRLDHQRARHEIPMLDLDGGETLYGVDTWIYAFGHRNQQFEKLLSLQWFRAILQRLYAFISYNRRIIITAAPGRWQLLDLQPDFRLSYRLTFDLLLLGIVGYLFSTIAGSYGPIMALVAGQLATVGLCVRLTSTDHFPETLLDYSGHLAMSLFIGGLFIKISQIAHCPLFVPFGYALLIGQHFIRTYRLGLSPWLSAWFTGLVFVFLLQL